MDSNTKKMLSSVINHMAKNISENFGKDIEAAGGSKDTYEKIRKQKQAQGDNPDAGEAPAKKSATAVARQLHRNKNPQGQNTAGRDKMTANGTRTAPMSKAKINQARGSGNEGAKAAANEKALNKLMVGLSRRENKTWNKLGTAIIEACVSKKLAKKVKK